MRIQYAIIVFSYGKIAKTFVFSLLFNAVFFNRENVIGCETAF